MGEHHDYWCERCGVMPAPLTIRIVYQGPGELPQPTPHRVCRSADCAADVLAREADRLRAQFPQKDL